MLLLMHGLSSCPVHLAALRSPVFRCRPAAQTTSRSSFTKHVSEDLRRSLIVQRLWASLDLQIAGRHFSVCVQVQIPLCRLPRNFPARGSFEEVGVVEFGHQHSRLGGGGCGAVWPSGCRINTSPWRAPLVHIITRWAAETDSRCSVWLYGYDTDIAVAQPISHPRNEGVIVVSSVCLCVCLLTR